MSAVDYLMKIDDINGESQDAKHKGSIEIESWSWGGGKQIGRFSSSHRKKTASRAS
jgi:type VI secretion system secreted protein Hcp